MGTFADTAIVDCHLSFAGQGKIYFSVHTVYIFIYCTGIRYVSVYVYKYIFPFSVYIYKRIKENRLGRRFIQYCGSEIIYSDLGKVSDLDPDP